jgi:hypothetical protein
MFRRTTYLILTVALMSTGAWAQGIGYTPPTNPVANQMYCGGVVTMSVPKDTYVISGPESNEKIVFEQGTSVFINKGADKGVKVGDQFLVSRVETDLLRYPWFVAQQEIEKAMGTYVADIGRLRVVSVQAKTSTAEIVDSCDYVQRGDIVEPFVERPAPSFKADAKLDMYAAPSGKTKATIIFGQNFASLAGAGKIVYVNIGSGQGVKVGDYFRIFRYQGVQSENAYQPDKMAHSVYGLGSTPVPYSKDDLPRDILGEGIVLRTGSNAATVLITISDRSIFAGDYVEIE